MESDHSNVNMKTDGNELDQCSLSLSLYRSIPLFGASNSMSLQIHTGLTHLGNMIDKIRNSRTGKTLQFSVYCEKEIAPCCIKLQACFQNIASCTEKCKEEHEEKMEMLTQQKCQADEKLRIVSSEQKGNETKISNCEDQINEAKHAHQISLNNIKDADENIWRFEAEIKDARSRQYLIRVAGGIATVASLFVPLTIPVIFASGACVGILALEKRKENFENLKRQEESKYNALKTSLQRKNTELENIKNTSEGLKQKMQDQQQIIQDLNTEIFAVKQRINLTVDVLQITRNVCRSVDNVSVAVNVLKLETTNAYALEPLITPLTELNISLHQLFGSLPNSDKDQLENTMGQIEDKQKGIKSIKFKESSE